MANWKKQAAVALAASTMVVAAPASATIFEYEMTNGDVLTIDTETETGTWVGDRINTTFTSSEFGDFKGGENPSFSFTLANMTGELLVRGQTVTPTTINGNRYHPQMLKTTGDGRINLWSWWGNPVIAGDYIKAIGGYTATEVPAPGVLGLLALVLLALGFGRRRRKTVAA